MKTILATTLLASSLLAFASPVSANLQQSYGVQESRDQQRRSSHNQRCEDIYQASQFRGRNDHNVVYYVEGNQVARLFPLLPGCKLEYFVLGKRTNSTHNSNCFEMYVEGNELITYVLPFCDESRKAVRHVSGIQFGTTAADGFTRVPTKSELARWRTPFNR